MLNWGVQKTLTTSLETLYDGSSNLIGYAFRDEKNIEEFYDEYGRLLMIEHPNGRSVTLQYEGVRPRLMSVTNEEGAALTFANNSLGKMTTVTAPNGDVVQYEYDGSDRLSQVVYPDETSGVSTDNPTRVYHYEDSNFPYMLTGITNENGVRYVTWNYDADGRVLSVVYAAGGVAQFAYDPDGSTTHTNQLGKSTTYHYNLFDNQRRITSVEGLASANCAAASRSYTYYPNGLIETQTDWSGNVTYFEYNTRGLVTKKIEAQGTPEERTTLTDWHTDWNLPIKITEPDRVIDMTYDADGLLLERQVTAVP